MSTSGRSCRGPLVVTSAWGLLVVAAVRSLRLNPAGRHRGVAARWVAWLLAPGMLPIHLMVLGVQGGRVWAMGSASVTVAGPDEQGRVRPWLLAAGFGMWVLLLFVPALLLLAGMAPPAVVVAALLVVPLFAELCQDTWQLAVRPDARESALRRHGSALAGGPRWCVLYSLVSGRPGRGDGRALVAALAADRRERGVVAVGYPATCWLRDVYLGWGAVELPVSPARRWWERQGHKRVMQFDAVGVTTR